MIHHTTLPMKLVERNQTELVFETEPASDDLTVTGLRPRGWPRGSPWNLWRLVAPGHHNLLAYPHCQVPSSDQEPVTVRPGRLDAGAVLQLRLSRPPPRVGETVGSRQLGEFAIVALPEAERARLEAEGTARREQAALDLVRRLREAADGPAALAALRDLRKALIP